jgi:hypothetical protein
MADETYRQDPRRRNSPDQQGEEDNNWAEIQQQREMMMSNTQDPTIHEENSELPFPNRQESEGGTQIRGNIPPQLQRIFTPKTEDGEIRTKQNHRKEKTFINSRGMEEDGHLKDLLRKLTNKTHHFEPIVLPSKGRFYDGSDGPTDGLIYLRPMTGEEEQILSTPRHVKRGKAIDMIFESCVQGKIDASKLLAVDRTYLLIYLRGISYTANYEVEVKCPECSHKYPALIDLDGLSVDECPDDYTQDSLEGVLPVSEFKFSYRLARGADEVEINNYRERRSKQWGDQATDDTLIYRTALLLDDIEGITDKSQIQQLARRLPIQDVAYIRDLVNTPPFGVDTDVDMICPSCYAEYTVDLPLESNFFFPRRKKSG